MERVVPLLVEMSVFDFEVVGIEARDAAAGINNCKLVGSIVLMTTINCGALYVPDAKFAKLVKGGVVAVQCG